ncbi:MAG: hypothetical protein WC959_00420 [Kiritimatiellales bacterium]
MKPQFYIILFIYAMMTAASTAWGVLAVDFGANYSDVEQNVSKAGTSTETGDYDFDGNMNDRRRFRPIDTPFIAINTKIHAEIKNSVFYGGYQVANFNSTDNVGNVNYYRYHAGKKALQISNKAGISDMGLAFSPHVKKADFLNGLSAIENLRFENTADSVSINVELLNGGKMTRALVKNGTNWYVSRRELTVAGKFKLNGYTETWYPYDPAKNQFFNTASPGTGVFGAELTDIQAFGILMQGMHFNGTKNNIANFRVAGFQVSLTP